jgi:mono/diheme cytochrome c family protein
MKKATAFAIINFLLITLQIHAQNGAELFKSTCSSCHTVGKGKLVGPDLSGVYNTKNAEWLTKFIRSSQAMVKAGDPDAVALFNEFKIPMPDNNLTDQQISSIIDFIKQTDGASQNTAGQSKAPSDSNAAAADSTRAAPDSTTVAVADSVPVNDKAVQTGRSYFYGKTLFANGAAPCISCHNIDDGSLLGGGKLARDLTGAYSRLGAAGITAILTNPPFPAMKSAIPGQLTNEEISSLNSLLKSASQTSTYMMSFPSGIIFFVLGFMIAMFLVVFLFIVYNDRKIPEGNVLEKMKRT